MKKIIRQGVFESNSSSSHSISIMRMPQEVELPKTIHFAIHTFHHYPYDGDDMDKLSGRANYLYSIAVWREDEKEFKKHMRRLLGDKIKLVFGRKPKWWNEDDDDDWNYAWDLINCNAREEAMTLYSEVMSDDVLMMNYLFDDKTEVEICGDWMIKGVTDDEDRWFTGYGKKQVEAWDDEW